MHDGALRVVLAALEESDRGTCAVRGGGCGGVRPTIACRKVEQPEHHERDEARRMHLMTSCPRRVDGSFSRKHPGLPTAHRSKPLLPTSSRSPEPSRSRRHASPSVGHDGSMHLRPVALLVGLIDPRRVCGPRFARALGRPGCDPPHTSGERERCLPGCARARSTRDPRRVRGDATWGRRSHVVHPVGARVRAPRA